MQFKAVLIGFRHGLYGIISISAAITIIIAIIITICIVIVVSIAVVITIAVTIDIVIVFSAVLFNVFLRILSLPLTCLFSGQLFIFLFQISNSHAPALCIGPLGEQIKPMIGAVKIDIDKRRLGRSRHFQLLRQVKNGFIAKIGIIRGICDQGKLPGLLHAKHFPGRSQIEAVLFFVLLPAAVAAPVDRAPARGVLLPGFCKKGIPAFLTDRFIGVDSIQSPRFSVDIQGRNICMRGIKNELRLLQHHSVFIQQACLPQRSVLQPAAAKNISAPQNKAVFF